MKLHARVVLGKLVGSITSGAHGHATGRTLAFAYVGPASAAPGTDLKVVMLGEEFPATALASPVYDAANSKLRG